MIDMIIGLTAFLSSIVKVIIDHLKVHVSNVNSSTKFFADDTSLFSIVHDPTISAFELNHDLNLIHQWARQWKMSFNPDPTKPAEEILFSVKRNSPIHPPIFYNGTEVKRVLTYKHLGLIFDPKLSFYSHIDEISATARKGIGLIKCFVLIFLLVLWNKSKKCVPKVILIIVTIPSTFQL